MHKQAGRRSWEAGQNDEGGRSIQKIAPRFPVRLFQPLLLHLICATYPYYRGSTTTDCKLILLPRLLRAGKLSPSSGLSHRTNDRPHQEGRGTALPGAPVQAPVARVHGAARVRARPRVVIAGPRRHDPRLSCCSVFGEGRVCVSFERGGWLLWHLPSKLVWVVLCSLLVD